MKQAIVNRDLGDEQPQDPIEEYIEDVQRAMIEAARKLPNDYYTKGKWC